MAPPRFNPRADIASMSKASAIGKWLYPSPAGLYCAAGDFHIDPHQPVQRAVITHGHADHARPGHQHVLATPETLSIMAVRYGEGFAASRQEAAYGARVALNGVDITLVPAGHILGSAQVVLEWKGLRAVVSGDYKRAADPTCAPFELQPCDVFITEATFGLPVFRNEPAEHETARLLASLENNTDRTHLLGVYGLGKCQRMLKLARLGGYEKPIYLHGALTGLTQLYERFGQEFGTWLPVQQASSGDLRGALVLCPPSALNDRWSRRMHDPLTAFASGWMRVRGRARQRGIELPLIVSDHADWPDLIATAQATGAEEIWITHGREEALVHQFAAMGMRARALSLIGFEDEAD